MINKTKRAAIGAALFIAIAGATATISNIAFQPLTVYAEEQTEYTFGTNVIGTLSSDGKTLTISLKDNGNENKDITNTLSSVLSAEQVNALNKIVIGDGVESVVADFATGLSNIKKLTLPDNIFLGAESFKDTGIKTLILPNNLSADPSGAFNGVDLTLKFPDTTTTIGDYAFAYSSIVSVDLRKTNVTSIGDGVFGFSRLQYIMFPEHDITLGLKVFEATDQPLKHIKINEYVKTTYDDDSNTGTFTSSSILKVEFEEGVTTIQNHMIEGTGVFRVELPSTLKYINSCAFMGCNQIKSITLPDSLLEIQKEAFLNCSQLESVNIPSGVKLSINCFSRCPLKRVSLDHCTLGDDVFDLSGIEILEVGEGCVLSPVSFRYMTHLKTVYIADDVTIEDDRGRDATQLFSCVDYAQDLEEFTLLTNNSTITSLDLENGSNRPIKIESPEITPSANALGNEGTTVSGDISPVTNLDLAFNLADGNFYIDGERNLYITKPITITSYTNTRVSVNLLDIEKNSDEPDLVAMDTYTDEEWANLSAEDTMTHLGISLNGIDIVGTYGNSSKDPNKKIHICDLRAVKTGQYPTEDITYIDLDVNCGKMFLNQDWDYLTYDLLFEFDLIP